MNWKVYRRLYSGDYQLLKLTLLEEGKATSLMQDHAYNHILKEYFLGVMFKTWIENMGMY